MSDIQEEIKDDILVRLKSIVQENKKIVSLAVVVIVFLFVTFFIFSKRDTRISASDYINLEFKGVNESGYMTYEINRIEIEKDLIKKTKLSQNSALFDDKYADIYTCLNNFEVELDKESELTNGEYINVTVKPATPCKYVKTSSKKLKVEGLVEGTLITNKEINANILVEFTGTSGMGNGSVRNLFKNGMAQVSFEVDPNKEISNGDTVRITVSDEEKSKASSLGFKFEENAQVEVTVSGLKETVETSGEISNIEDVTRLLKEKIDSKFKSSRYSSYEIKTPMYYAKYVASNADVNKDLWNNNFYDGSLGYVVFTTGKYDNKVEKYFVGFGDVILDENNAASLNNLDLLTKKYDSRYSIESIQKIIESDAFKNDS